MKEDEGPSTSRPVQEATNPEDSHKRPNLHCHATMPLYPCRHFPTLEECVQQLKNKEGCEIIGIEITDDAQPVHSHPFQGDCANCVLQMLTFWKVEDRFSIWTASVGQKMPC
eukprot:scaffold122593_cov19-Tisochrysis_lutea.AAC.1